MTEQIKKTKQDLIAELLSLLTDKEKKLAKRLSILSLEVE